MAYIDWTAAFEDTPSGSDPGSVIDNKFTEFKEQTRRLLQAAGINLPQITVTEDGTTLHTPGTKANLPGVIMVDAGGSGIGGQIWKSDGSAILMDPKNTGVDFPGTLPVTGTNIDSGANPGHQHDVTFAIALGTSTGGLIPGLVFENRGNGLVTLLEARLVAGISPSGGSIFVQMRLLPSGYTDPSAAGTEVFATINRPEITTGLFRGSPTVTFDDPTLEEDEAWTFEIDTDGSSPNGAAEVTLFLHVQRN